MVLFLLSSCSTDDDSYYNAAFDRALMMNNAGQRANAVKYIDSFFVGRRPSGYMRYKRYFFKQWTAYYSKDYERSELYVDSMLYELEHDNLAESHQMEYARALNAKGDCHSAHDELSKAFECYYKARIAAEAAKDTCALGNQSYQLGMVTYKQKHFEDAIKYFETSIKHTHGCGNDSMDFCKAQELYSNIGLCYTRLRKFDSAIASYNKALDYIAKNRVKFGAEINAFSETARGVIMGNMAKIYMFRKEYDTAKQLMLESIAINEKPGKDNMDALYVKLNLSEVYGHTNAYGKMYFLLRQIGAIVDSVKGVRETKADLEWRYNMYRYFRYIDRPTEALKWVDSFQRLKDTVDAAQKRYSQTNISQLLEGQETKYQNELLKKERYLDKLYLTVTVIVGLMAIVIGILTYFNYRRSKRNVIELTALNKEVNSQKIQLQQIVNEKDTILHIVAHDLRDPIGGINYLAHYIHERETDELLKKQLSVIEHTSQSSLALINELVELSDLTRHNGTWDKDVYDVNELVKTIVAMLEFKAKDKEQQLIVTYARTPVYICVHQEKLLRALCNIISNAIKFSRRQEIIFIAVDAEKDSVTISVKDNGIGIPEKMKPLVFSQFSDAKRRGTEGEKSYGLGLSVSKKIITEEGGRLWYESEENKGTIFYMEFPVRKN